MPATPHAMVTFMFTDIEGSTRLWDRFTDEMGSVLSRHNALLHAHITRFGGVIIKQTGDGVFAAFPGHGALSCAVAVQQALGAEDWGAVGELRVRIGLDAGRAERQGDDYYGPAVNRAARIMDAGHGGQVLCTPQVIQVDGLPDGVTLQDLGAHVLRGFASPQQIYGVLHPAWRWQTFPPLRLSKGDEDIAPADLPNPYKGLAAFGAEDAELFFGREALVAEMAEKLAERRFLAVVGPSGSGKSSAVRAGLLPCLTAGALPSSETWSTTVLTPGEHPMENIEPREQATASLTPGLLVVDQFEEVFTLTRDEAERHEFITTLLHLADDTQSETRVVLILRADFYGHCAAYPALAAHLQTSQLLVGPMREDELRAVIEQPAAKVGLQLEAGLVDAILADVAHEPGALPLLSHALFETFNYRRGAMLTLAGYARSGGIRAAIAKTAEMLYQTLSERQQAIARNIFLRLTEVSDAQIATRRRAALEELVPRPQDAPEVATVLHLLADARLTTTDEGTVEVAHEALIREWPTLRAWLAQGREGLRVHRHLTQAAQEWARAGRESGELYRGARLAQATEWAAGHDEALNPLEREFLAASQVEAQREAVAREEQQRRELELAQQTATAQRSAATRLRYLVGALAVFLVVAGALSVFAWRQSQAAQANATAAEANAAQAQANFTRAEAQRLAAEATTLFQTGDAPFEQIALLSLRSMNIQYSPLGDEALVRAATLNLPRRLFRLAEGRDVYGLAFSPDGRYVLTNSGSTAQLWETAVATRVRTFSAGSDVLDATFSPDGRYILTAHRFGTAVLWDVETSAVIRTLSGSPQEIRLVAFAADGNSILTGGQDGVARLWDLQSGQQMRTYTGGAAAALSPDGKYVETRDGLHELGTGILVRPTQHPSAVALAFSPDGKYIAGAFNTKTAWLWNAETGEDMYAFTSPIGSITTIAFSPSGKYLLSNGDRAVHLWDVQTGSEARRFVGQTAPVLKVAFSPDGRHILTASSDGTAHLWDTEPRPSLPRFVGHSDSIISLAVSLDGRFVLTSSLDKTVRLWDARTGQELRRFEGDNEPVTEVAFAPDGERVLMSGYTVVRVRDLRTDQELLLSPGHNPVYDAAFSSDGQYILTTGGDATAKLWDAHTGSQLKRYGHDPDPQLVAVAFSHDGRYILTGARQNILRVWDTQTSAAGSTYLNSRGNPVRVAFSPDDRFVLAAAGPDVYMWTRESSVLPSIITGHTGGVRDFAFSPDGKYLLTGSNDRTARLWDIQAIGNPGGTRETRRFAGHAGAVTSVAFTPDGSQVLTGSEDGTARLWLVDYHEVMRDLCARLQRDFTDAERAEYGIPDTTPTCAR